MPQLSDEEITELCRKAFRQGLSVTAEGLFDHVMEDHSALQRVWRLHRPRIEPGMYRISICIHDGQTYPCETVQAVLGEVSPVVSLPITTPDGVIPPQQPAP
jgi:hypothetical protein